MCIPRVLTWLSPPTGDEPFYLMTAISLLEDYDLNEANNFAQGSYLSFAPPCAVTRQHGWGSSIEYPGFPAPGLRFCNEQGAEAGILSELPPHPVQGVIRDGTYSKHGLGLSFLIAPLYAVFGRLGAVLTIAIFAVLLGVQLRLLFLDVGVGPRLSAALSLGIPLAPPLFFYSFLLFPAIPAAFSVVVCYRKILRLVRLRYNAGGELNNNHFAAGQYLVIGSLLSTLLLLHTAYLALIIPLLMYLFFGGRRVPIPMSSITEEWRLIFVLLPFTSVVAGLISYSYWIRGTISLGMADHAGFAELQNLLLAAQGLLFDQKWGLIPYAPLYLLAPVGAVLLLSDAKTLLRPLFTRREAWWLVATMAPYLLVITSYNQWWGEWCPPARYLVPILPLLVLPGVQYVRELCSDSMSLIVSRTSTAFAGGLFIVSWAVSLAYIINPKRFFHWQNDTPSHFFSWLDSLIGTHPWTFFTTHVPSYVTTLNVPLAAHTSVVWTFGCALLVMFLSLPFVLKR